MSSSTTSSESNTSSFFSKLASNWPIVLSGVITSGFFIASFVLTSQTLGDSDGWATVKKEVMTKVWPLTIIGSVLLFITSALYILQDPHNTMYYLLVLGCISICLSYSSLVISMISK
jgi:hypothetical protein